MDSRTWPWPASKVMGEGISGKRRKKVMGGKKRKERKKKKERERERENKRKSKGFQVLNKLT